MIVSPFDTSQRTALRETTNQSDQFAHFIWIRRFDLVIWDKFNQAVKKSHLAKAPPNFVVSFFRRDASAVIDPLCCTTCPVSTTNWCSFGSGETLHRWKQLGDTLREGVQRKCFYRILQTHHLQRAKHFSPSQQRDGKTPWRGGFVGICFLGNPSLTSFLTSELGVFWSLRQAS